MTLEIASFPARICPATCSAERTITSSSFSTLSAPAIHFSFKPKTYSTQALVVHHQALPEPSCSLASLACNAPICVDAGGKALPPVHLWNPPFCGDLDMRIASDGTWFYMGTPIGRPALVRLFSTILKREDGKHFLVTPVEKVGIRVDDAPFLAVEMVRESDSRGRLLRFRTNVDDWVPCDSSHRLRFEAAADGGLTPYLHVRSDLWAKA